ncbi:MAG: D-alanyl-D-alanine carboxypeptidase family protein [Pseudomonadota bacterium]
MKVRERHPVRNGLFILAALWLVVALPLSAVAAPYAAMVMDARTGEVLHARNADTRLHPASLTKMMTLYIAFEAVERGEISMDTKVLISKKAAAEVPSKLGLKAGSRIKLRYLVRAAAIKSANDAATAIGEAISGSEAAFARRMTRTAKALGMTRTTFKNAHGLTEQGHLSTARDMTVMGRRLFYDFPQYYNIFSRQSTYAGLATVRNTNRRMLSNYRGADGIKTGYTRAAGFNLVASAERGNERVIATVFGGKSTTSRNARVAELLDMGFRRAPSRAPVRKPSPPVYSDNGAPGGSGKTIRVSGQVKTSYRPKMRPGSEPVLVASAAPLSTNVRQDDIQSALAAAQAVDVTPALRPAARPARAKPVGPEIVTRLSTSGGRHWGVNVGRYTSRYKAEKVLLKTALQEMATLDGALRKVVRRPQGFEATFMGLTRDGADRACRRLQARGTTCFMVGPS